MTCYIEAPLTPTPEVTCYTVVPGTPTPTGSVQRGEVLTDVTQTGDINPNTVRQVQAADARARLRDCWFWLDDLLDQTKTDWEAAQAAQKALVEAHQAVLDELVALEDLGAAAAEHVQAAFAEASFHVWRNNAPLTCYKAMPFGYEPREDLVLRADTLLEVSGDLDPTTVEKVQAALARDMAVFDAVGTPAFESSEVAKLWESGEIELDDEMIEAARYLIDLLGGGDVA
jgi:hypothetical protein